MAVDAGIKQASVSDNEHISHIKRDRMNASPGALPGVVELRRFADK